MVNPMQFNAVVPPYKYNPQQLPNKQIINPVANNIGNLPPQSADILSPENLTQSMSELNIQDIEEAASLIFDIVEKDYLQ
jgi:hypothetical protein